VVLVLRIDLSVRGRLEELDGLLAELDRELGDARPRIAALLLMSHDVAFQSSLWETRERVLGILEERFGGPARTEMADGITTAVYPEEVE
jgi:hypothetical protein